MASSIMMTIWLMMPSSNLTLVPKSATSHDTYYIGAAMQYGITTIRHQTLPVYRHSNAAAENRPHLYPSDVARAPKKKGALTPNFLPLLPFSRAHPNPPYFNDPGPESYTYWSTQTIPNFSLSLPKRWFIFSKTPSICTLAMMLLCAAACFFSEKGVGNLIG